MPGTPHTVLLEPPKKPEISLCGRCRSQTDPTVFERTLLLSGKHLQPRAGCCCSHHPLLNFLLSELVTSASGWASLAERWLSKNTPRSWLAEMEREALLAHGASP